VSFESNAAVAENGAAVQPAGARLRNVTELRLLFAASVMLSHAALLAAGDAHRLLRTILNSEAAVQAFFILSGYLVCGSYGRLRDPLQFYTRRVLRIYPAYLVAVLLFLALGLGQAMILGNAVAWGDLPRYLIANLTTLNFLQPTVGGVFASNLQPMINGALWSIKVELCSTPRCRCYSGSASGCPSWLSRPCSSSSARAGGPR
jgi:peptidoglycan/LPS O-acetylase OafA/YrhL